MKRPNLNPVKAVGAAALGLLVLSVPLAAHADDPVVGDTEARVLELLGEPGGQIRSGNWALMLYNRGRVEIRDGQVEELSLVSAEAARNISIEKTARKVAMMARRETEGEMARERILEEPTFAERPAREQVDLWRRFRQRYPGIDVTAEYRAALSLREKELELERNQQRLDDLERRVLEAEWRAAEAERNAGNRRSDYGWGWSTLYLTAPGYSTCRRPVKPICPPVATPYSGGARFTQNPLNRRSPCTTTYGGSLSLSSTRSPGVLPGGRPSGNLQITWP